METLEVVAGVIFRNKEEGKVLIGQKREDHKVIPGKWEFPGGKMKPIDKGNHEKALDREFDEEFYDLILERVVRSLGKYNHSYDGRTKINLHAYLCQGRGNPIPKEHARIEWVKPQDLLSYDLAFIDREVTLTLLGIKI